jgi:Tfp pilus assembly protein PilF
MLLPWIGVLALQACSTTAAPQGAAAEIVTPSDESDARRRARIRLELAVGYFEAGKVAFALDEVKQALASDPWLCRCLQSARFDLHATQRSADGGREFSPGVEPQTR